MIYKTRINKKNIFNLVEFNTGVFNTDNKLKLITDDMRTVKDIFTNLETIEIYANEDIVAEYSIFNGFSMITYLGPVFCEGLNTFVECLEITLTKTNLIEEVERIKNIVEPVIDIDSMTIDELKDYKIGLINTAGSQDIYSGDFVELSDKTTKIFSYSQHDQANLESYLALILAADDRENLYIAYHGQNETCRQYNYIDIVLIYFTLSMKKLRVFTYVNMLRDWIKTMSDIEQVKNIQYGTALPLEYQNQMNTIMEGSLASLMAIKEKFIPSVEPDPETGEDDEEE